MKKILLTLIAVCSLSLTTACAQNGPCAAGGEILTVDMAKVYNSYGKAERSKEQFQKAVEKAQEEMRAMLDEGIGLAKELQEIQEKMDNPALSDAARSKFRKQAEDKTEEVRKKETEVNQFRQETDRQLMQRREEFVTQHVQEIRKVIGKIAAKRGAKVVLNTAGVEVLFSDSDLDISEDVIRIINKIK